MPNPMGGMGGPKPCMMGGPHMGPRMMPGPNMNAMNGEWSLYLSFFSTLNPLRLFNLATDH